MLSSVTVQGILVSAFSMSEKKLAQMFLAGLKKVHQDLRRSVQTANGYCISRRIAGLCFCLVRIGSFCKGKEENDKYPENQRDNTRNSHGQSFQGRVIGPSL